MGFDQGLGLVRRHGGDVIDVKRAAVADADAVVAPHGAPYGRATAGCWDLAEGWEGGWHGELLWGYGADGWARRRVRGAHGVRLEPA